MLTYRDQIHSLANAVSAEAVSFSVELIDCCSQHQSPDYQPSLVTKLRRLLHSAESLKNAVDRLRDYLKFPPTYRQGGKSLSIPLLRKGEASP